MNITEIDIVFTVSDKTHLYSLISLLIPVYLIETTCKLLMLKNLLDLDHLLLADDFVCL